MDANSSYDFQIYIRDQLNTLSGVNLYFTVPQGTPLVALRKKKICINTPTPDAALNVFADISHADIPIALRLQDQFILSLLQEILKIQQML